MGRELSKRKILRCLLSCFLVFTSLATPLSNSSSSWLRQGAYVKYASSSTAFRWECISIDGSVAELSLSYSVNDTILYSGAVHVDAQNRSTYLLNGTYLGKTVLWLPANPAQGEKIEMLDNKTGEADVGGWVPTVQGAQKVFSVSWDGFWDLDTGTLLSYSGYPSLADPVFRAIGLPSFGDFEMVETNIDLGPREWLPEIIYALPYLLPIIAFVVVFIFLLRRRQRKKKQRETLMGKQRRLRGKAESQNLRRPQTKL